MTTLMNHPTLLVFVVLSFLGTILAYIAPYFTRSFLVISENFNLGTFCGTLIHKNWGHYFGNIILLIPFWIYLDNKLGKSFILIIVLINMLFTGLYGIFAERELCGLSGVLFMLMGISCIIGSWLVFFFAGAMFVSEFWLIHQEDDDNTSHIAHIVFFIIGIAIGFGKILYPIIM